MNAKTQRRGENHKRVFLCASASLRQRLRFWPFAVLLAQALIFFRQALFSRHFTLPWDFLFYHYPLAAIMRRSFAAGEFPLWDPLIYCGRPFYAVIQAQAFYPPAILTALAGAIAGERKLVMLMEIATVAHVAMAGIFAYLLLRALRLDKTPAVIGATVYQLGAFFASQAQHMGAVDGAAWMPLAWWAVVRLGQAFTWRRLAILAAALALSFLAGFTPMTFMVFASTGILALALAAVRAARPMVPLYAAAGMAWAALLSAIQLFPSMELMGLSVAAQRAQFGDGGGLPLAALVTLVWPNRWGVFQFDAVAWKLPWNPTWLYLYCGIPALVFAAVALVRRAGREAAVFAALTLAFGLWMLGGSTIVGRTVYPLWPAAVRNAMYVEFAMAPFVLALGVLAAIGAQGVLAGRRPWLQAAAVLVVSADLILAGSGRPMNTSWRDEPGITYRQLDGVTEAPLMLRDLTRRSYPPSRIDSMGGSRSWIPCSPLFDVPTAGGDDPLALVRMLRVRTLFGEGLPWERYYDVVKPASPVLALLNVEYLLSRPEVPGQGLERVAEMPGMAFWRNPAALPRFFLVGRTERAADLEDALARLRAPDFDPRGAAVVEGPVDGPVSGGGSVRVLGYGSREVTLETNAGAPSLLVTSEAWYPGWRAWIDGRERPLVLTNAAFRGLAVPAGRHAVRMRFEPAILWQSAVVTLAALLALAAALARPKRGAA